jgi:integrase
MRTAAACGLHGDSSARIDLALDPRFAGDTIVFNDEESARGLFHVCEVAACLRARRTRGLCSTHLDRWRRQGRPTIQAFLADPGPPTAPEQIRLVGLGPQLRSEVALGIQLAAARPRIRQLTPSDVQRLAETLAQRGVTSILAQDGKWSEGLSESGRTALANLRDALEDLVAPPDPSLEFDRDVWRLGVMGHAGVKGANGRLRFDAIPQQWLAQLVKRFMRWRIATGKSYHQLNRDITALQRLADAFTAQAGPQAEVRDFTRETIEVYLVMLVRLGLKEASRSYDISSVSTFLRTTRQHDWQPDLSPSASVFPGDHPRRPAALPRALPEFAMAQIESPEALAQLAQPHRLMMQILIGTGLRLTDAYRLSIDCLVRDAQGAPYLRYRNHKMNREAIVPIDDQLATAIGQQAHTVLEQMPHATHLAPGPSSRDGRRPRSSGPVTARINAGQQTIGLQDEHGRPFRFTAHQLRHTYGTRLINADVPQEVVRRLLDHESAEMTARYARLNDQTIRRHWERARKVNIHGETVALEQGSPLSDAAWMKENLGRATMALPNGYCGLPLQQSCPHANACLTCPVFITTPDFLAEHLAQLRATNRLIGEAEAKGQARLAEMNQQVAANLEIIITAIQTPSEDTGEEDLDAS